MTKTEQTDTDNKVETAEPECPYKGVNKAELLETLIKRDSELLEAESTMQDLGKLLVDVLFKHTDTLKDCNSKDTVIEDLRNSNIVIQNWADDRIQSLQFENAKIPVLQAQVDQLSQDLNNYAGVESGYAEALKIITRKQ